MNKLYISAVVRKIFIIILIIISALILFENYYSKNRVTLGLYLGETYIGGMSYKQLDNYLEELATEYQNYEVVLYLPQGEASFHYCQRDLGIYYAVDKTTEIIKNTGTPFKFRDKYALLRFGRTIQPIFKIDEFLLHRIMRELEKSVIVEARDAEVWAEGGELIFRPHQHGTALHLKKLSALLLQELSAWPVLEVKLSIPLEQREAEVTVSTILENGIKDKLYTATTIFNPANDNRVHNINLASAEVNNIILKPGDIFSFNELVGEASLASGYKEAPVIVSEELVMGAGGGICQVSSTLYKAALMTGMTIVERYNHGLPVSYLPPGLDAAVSYDYLDLKFTNETDTSVLVNTEVVHNVLNVTFFGNTSPLGKIEIIRQDLKTITPPEHYRIVDGRPSWYREIIQEGKPGYEVETLRVFYKDEIEISRESFGKDYYAPVPYIYAVGNIPRNNDH